ncbi:hypothetical protein OAQ84_01915 [Bdellovibrionales bacterium]|nr:hypothetical protein [Bdellovibrionales bacterium]
MKELLIGLTVLISVSSFASDTTLKVKDVCEKVNFKVDKNSNVDFNKVSLRGSFEKGEGYIVSDYEIVTGMSFCQAKVICKKFGLRLPTAYELAEQAIPNGIKIFNLESFEDVEEQVSLKGLEFRQISTIWLEHLSKLNGYHQSNFWIDSSNYNLPLGKETYPIWTSSYKMDDTAYVFWEKFGGFGAMSALIPWTFRPEAGYSARCVTKH